MSDLAISFASLVKSNNGLFKSAAQAEFLLSQCDGGLYATGGAVYGSTFQLHYMCDAKGVVRVEKHTRAKGMAVEWEREGTGTETVQQVKERKRILRNIKQVEKSIKDRQDAWTSGRYDASIDLYHSSTMRDQTDLAAWKSRLANL